jgi:2-polyprenyl-3-methyl-5-hydroxy-6-metoxy-1,4-benzoquinol methylase
MIREAFIRKIVEGKDVLDIGSIGQDADYSLWKDVLVKSNANSLTGIDFYDSIKTAEDKFNVTREHLPFDNRIIFGDMENHVFHKKFDIIIAGDVLEHVNNQGLFLNNIHLHLADHGKLVITTPNAKWLTVIFKPNSTHTLWHDRFTLEYILHLNGFKVTNFAYYYGNKKYYSWWKRILALRQAMLVVAEKI